MNIKTMKLLIIVISFVSLVLPINIVSAKNSEIALTDKEKEMCLMLCKENQDSGSEEVKECSKQCNKNSNSNNNTNQNTQVDETIDCGDNIIGIPVATAKIIRTSYLLIKILVPLFLVILGMLDFGRAVVGSDSDKIKSEQKKFVKRLIAAVILFLTLAIVEFVMSLLASAGFSDATACIDAILNRDF